MNQSMKSPLVTNMSDDVHVMNADNLTKQKTGVTMYAMGNLFKGEPLASNTDLNSITEACFRRVDSTIVNGPPILDPTGYIHVMSVYHAVNQESSAIPRIRQIVYPDNVNDPTPYTRVGYSATAGGTITWSPWNTLGGNMIRRLLLHDITSDTPVVANRGYALPNSMYESFGDFNLELPNPSQYSLGTKIGLEQWRGHGKVLFKSGANTYEQQTAPDIDIDGNYIGGMIYLFEIVDAEGSTTANPIYEWKMDTLQNYDGVISALQLQLAEHRLADQTNVASVIRSSQSHSYVVPQAGYIYAKDANGNYLGTALRVNGTNNGVKIRAVNAGDVITFNGTVADSVTVTFTPDEHAMYLRDDELNSSWHDKIVDASIGLTAAGKWSDSVHLKNSDETPASVKAVLDLQIYVDQRDDSVLGIIEHHTGFRTADPRSANTYDFAHRQYMQWSRVVNSYNSQWIMLDANGRVIETRPSSGSFSTVQITKSDSALKGYGTYNGYVASAYSVYMLYSEYAVPNIDKLKIWLTTHTCDTFGQSSYTSNTDDAAHRQYIPWSQVVNTYKTSYASTSTELPAAGVNNTNGKIASAKAVYDLYVYANNHISQSAYASTDVHAQYVLKRALVTNFHTTQDPTSGNTPVTAPSVGALYKLASALQAKGLLYGAVRNGKTNLNDDAFKVTGIYDISGVTANGPIEDKVATTDGQQVSRATLIVIAESSATASTTAVGDTQSTTYVLQILVSKSGFNNIWYRTLVNGTWMTEWTRFAKTKRTFLTSASVDAATIQGYLKYCEPTFKCNNTSAITITLPEPSVVMDGCRINVEVHNSGTVTIKWGDNTYAATLTNGNATYIPLESDGSSWYMICVG